MIKLAVKKRCHGCPNFSPTAVQADGMYFEGTLVNGDTFVVCENDTQCAAIAQYLADRLTKEEEE